ncbi:MAG: L,D-transpeptidase family protein, partial [Prevotellaceae bacterium]|nr:L,D-transpeptidase family protein [Prevotellaceae bacterium]
TEIVYTAQYAVTNAKAPATPTLSTYSSYNSIRLEWTPVTNPNEKGSYKGATVYYKLYYGKSVIYDGTATSFHHKGLNPLSSYSYRIQAYLKDANKNTTASALSGYKYDSPVRSMRYRITIKRSGTLKSHSGRKQKYKVKKGQVIYADRFQTGKYIFDYNGSTFYVARTRVGKKAAEYVGAGGWNYSRKEAEYYVRDRGLSSGTGVLVWVNTYTQHVYYFNRGAAGWTCADDWECSTGTASTPTPSGTNGMKAIKKKIKKKNGIKWWSTFNGNAALHGRKKNKPVGNVASNGCVRNPDEKAYKIFSYAGKGTRVMIY